MKLSKMTNISRPTVTKIVKTGDGTAKKLKKFIEN